MNFTSAVRAFPVLFLLSLQLARAQDVPLPPKPQDAGPTLEATLKFIQYKLPSKVSYIEHLHNDLKGTDDSQKWTMETSNVSADTGRCTLAYQYQMNVGDRTDSGATRYVLPLKNVSDIEVMPYEEAMNLKSAKGGNPELKYVIDPSISALLLNPGRGEIQFLFYDETLSHRVAKALQHAVELCGGGNKEPF